VTRAEQIIAECGRRGVILSLGEHSDALLFDAPKGALTPELRAALVEHKPDVIQVIFEREERAALMGVEEWVDASLLARALNHPATMMLLRAFAPLGIELMSVRPFNGGLAT
jgi:hypothetical protein